jgi:NAD(P)-dependent dehydrogenase (short-subunit alcohol dehydrogenase family)
VAKGLFDCTGKVTVVTGGNGGIGLGFAMGVARMGGDIAIWARNAEKSAVAKAQLEEAGAGKVIAYHVDVSEEQNVIDGYGKVMEDFGRVDCVFANSGAAPLYDSVFDLPTEHWFEFQKTAMHGAFFTLREGARLMKQRVEGGDKSGGSLVACGSLSLFQGLPGKMEYAASKCAVAATIRCLAIELAPLGIRANIVAPGLIITPMMGDAARAQAIADHYAPAIPMQRCGAPADFEGIGAYLCSDASTFMTGETITIDGGYMVRP